jgi:hypothetical protein
MCRWAAYIGEPIFIADLVSAPVIAVHFDDRVGYFDLAHVKHLILYLCAVFISVRRQGKRQINLRAFRNGAAKASKVSR